MELTIDINDAMKIKELTQSVIDDWESVDLLAEYIRDELWSDPFDDTIFEWLEYFLNSRWLEINWLTRVEVMRNIDDYWHEVEDKAWDLDWKECDDFYIEKSKVLAEKIIHWCEPLGCITDSKGMVTLPEDKISKTEERITYAELDRRIGWSILCNNLWEKELELVSWDLFEKDEFGREKPDSIDIFQWYIISDSWADYLKSCTDEIVYYYEDLDIYVWWITHLGTSWDYVYLTIHY